MSAQSPAQPLGSVPARCGRNTTDIGRARKCPIEGGEIEMLG